MCEGRDGRCETKIWTFNFCGRCHVMVSLNSLSFSQIKGTIIWCESIGELMIPSNSSIDQIPYILTLR